MTELIGHAISHYQILEEIGRGGMATVYRAYQDNVGRDVAIKILPHQFTHAPTFLARFEREVAIAARVQHPRILPVFDVGHYQGQPYIVMAYMPGGTLEDRIRGSEGRGLPLGEAARYATQIGEGLDHLHGMGIVHRDLKPSNVLLDASGDCFLSDFGIAYLQEATAHLTGTGLLGTPGYMAPEIFRQGQASPASDIYALGMVLYELLAGQPPFEAESPAQWMRAHIEKPLPDLTRRPDLPEGVNAILQAATAKDPARRYASAGQLAQTLGQAARARPRPRKRPRRPSWVWGLIGVGGIGILALALIGGVLLMGGTGNSDQTTPTLIEPVVAAVETATSQPTPAVTAPPTDTPAPTLTPTPIPVIGGGTGILGFNFNNLGYTVDVSCIVAGGVGCDPNPHILPEIAGVTPLFGIWSPDGSRIAFVRAAEVSHIYIMDLVTPRLLQVDPAQRSANPVWSPDGTRLAYLSEGDIYITDLACQPQAGEVCAISGTMILDYPTDFIGFDLIAGWLPGDHLIIHNPRPGSYNWYTMDTAGHNLQFFATRLGSFTQGTDYMIWLQGSDFYVQNRQTGASWVVARLVEFKSGTATSTMYTVSPDGRYLAYSYTADLAHDTEVFLLDLSCVQEGYLGCEGKAIPITDNGTGDTAVSFSPDGKWLAFIRASRVEVREFSGTVTVCTGGLCHEEFREGRYLVNTGGDIYVFNVDLAAAGAREEAIIRLTTLQFVEWDWGVPGSNLSWQPALAP